MTELEILDAIFEGEAVDWEFKAAQGGFPNTVWDTYSAMANTDGGVIILGVEEADDHYEVRGVPNPDQTKRTFWNGVRNQQLVSVCVVNNDHVRSVEVAGQTLVAIHVPRATRQQRPVYRGRNPLSGTYRRNEDGDYLCTPDEVRRMLAEQTGESLDTTILEGFGIEDLDPVSLQQYRQRWASREPDHPFLSQPEREFLESIGGYRVDRQSRLEGITTAGLLMFGKSRAILDPHGVPGFHLDYREWLSESPEDRWTDRVTYDGRWECNLFQFVQRVLVKLTAEVPVRFQLQANLSRRDDTDVHEAIREALINTLIHADHTGQGGVVIDRRRDQLEFSNPGALLVSVEQVYRGGVSECRNKTLQKMFGFLGYGEHAGSGFPRIVRGWSSQHWRMPLIRETLRPDRVSLLMRMVSLLPEESVQKLRESFGDQVDRLNPLELQALVTAELDGGVSNSRMQQVSYEHPSDLTRVLQGLVAKGLLEQQGHRRWTTYRLGPPQTVESEPLETPGDSQQSAGDSQQSTEGSQQTVLDSQQSLDELPSEELERLRELASRSGPGSHLRRAEMQGIILGLCSGRYLTRHALALLVNRNPDALRNRFLVPMVQQGLLRYRFPDDPNRPDQAYTTAEH